MRTVSFVAILSIVLRVPLGATVLVPADLGELARDARAIARGRVVAVEPRWTDDRRSVDTIVTLAVDAYLKGPLGPVVQFRVPGGELGRFRTIVVGAPELSTDDRVIVFLGARGPSIPYVLGLSQGLFRLVRSSADDWVVLPPAALAAPTVRGDPSRRAMPLGDFEARVRALAASGR